MKTHLFRVECLTDMHVGSGEATYSVIDNEVQKDTVLQDVPIIHASGVKGALKEHCERRWGKTDEKIKSIFGHKDGAGEYKFFSAICLARPLRVTDGNKPYILATSSDILDHLKGLLKGIGRSDAYDKGIGKLTEGKVDIEIEGTNEKIKKCSAVSPLIGAEFAEFKSLENYDLPVRARNVLDDTGQSKNLWYEELVPHKSIFFFAVMAPDNDDNFKLFKEAIEGSTVQFGGNASIGNGYTTIKEVLPL